MTLQQIQKFKHVVRPVGHTFWESKLQKQTLDYSGAINMAQSKWGKPKELMETSQPMVYNEISFYVFYSSDCIIVEGDLVKIQP